jgi:hypothetical protein
MTVFRIDLGACPARKKINLNLTDIRGGGRDKACACPGKNGEGQKEDQSAKAGAVLHAGG